MYEELDDDGKRRYTVEEIAGTFAVSRKTIYRHLAKEGVRRQPDKTTRPRSGTQPTNVAHTPPGSASTATAAPTAQPRQRPPSAGNTRAALTCPTCGHEPATRSEALRLRADRAVVWLHQDTANSAISTRQHCFHCQPHEDCALLECARCGDGPILTGALTNHTRKNPRGQLPAELRTWLTQQGWQTEPDPVCPGHQR